MRAPRLSRLRSGELLATLGAIALATLTFLPWYRGPAGGLTAWDEFGVVDVLIVVAVLVALTLTVTTLTERTPALPVASAVWTTLIGFIVSIAILVAVLDKPDHALVLLPAGWLSLVAGVAILAGGWQSLRDERTSRYPAAELRPRTPRT